VKVFVSSSEAEVVYNENRVGNGSFLGFAYGREAVFSIQWRVCKGDGSYRAIGEQDLGFLLFLYVGGKMGIIKSKIQNLLFEMLKPQHPYYGEQGLKGEGRRESVY
jgi:hypothetical protein